jgi:hypothetical protein
MLGMSYGAEQLHYILELPFGSPAFLHDVERSMSFARNPIYAVIHEACYATASRPLVGRARLPGRAADDPTFLTGEHIYPWMFEDYGALRRSPRRRRSSPSTSGRALRRRGWPGTRSRRGRDLRRGHVRRARASPRRPPPRSAACALVTNEYEHDGLRANGERVLGRPLDLVQGRA